MDKYTRMATRAAYSAATRTTPTNIAFTVTALATGPGVLSTGAQYALKDGSGEYGSWVNYNLSATAPSPTSTLVIGGLTAGATYKVRLVGFNTSSITDSSTAISGTESTEAVDILMFVTTPTTAPNLTVQGSTSIKVIGTTVSGATRYILQRSDSSSFTPYIDVCTNITSASFYGTGYTDYFSFVEGNTYYYRYIAVTSNGTQSLPSPVSSITIPGLPGAPTDLSAVASGNTSVVGVSWNAPISNGGSAITQYNIEKSTDQISWGSAGANTSNTSQGASGLSSGTVYYFRVFANNDRGRGPPSTPVQCSTRASAPTNVVSSYIDINSPYNDPAEGIIIPGSSVSSSKMLVSFTASSGNGVTGYNVYNASTNALVATDLSTNILVTGLTKGTSYQFYVKAITKDSADVDQLSAASSSSVARVAATGPANMGQVTVNNVTSTTARLSWAPVNGNGLTTNYRIDLVTAFGPPIVTETVVASITDISYTLTSLSPNTNYTYKVTPFTNAGEGMDDQVMFITLDPPFSVGSVSSGSGTFAVSYNGSNFNVSNTPILSPTDLSNLVSDLNGTIAPIQITIPADISGDSTITVNGLAADITAAGYNTPESNAILRQLMSDVTPSGTASGKVVVQTQTASGNKTAVATVAVVDETHPNVTTTDPTASTPSRAAITTSSLPTGSRVMFGVIDEPGKLSFVIKAFDAANNLIILSASPIPVLIHKPHAQVVEGSDYKPSLYFSHYNPDSSVEEGIILTREPTSDIGSGESLMVAYSGIININLVLTEGPVPPPSICFLGDAPILTPRGYRRADSLCVGDKVLTADGRSVAVQRIFTKTYQPSASVNPYVIPAGQYGATEDVMISPEHRVMVSGKGLMEARKLGLKQHKMAGEFTYYNIELPNWQTDNLVIGGVEAESLAPVRRLEITKGEFLTLLKTKYGKLTPDVIARACRTCFMTASGKVNIPVFSPSAKK